MLPSVCCVNSFTASKNTTSCVYDYKSESVFPEFSLSCIIREDEKEADPVRISFRISLLLFTLPWARADQYEIGQAKSQTSSGRDFSTALSMFVAR